jgi:hypothetical protein
MGPNSSPKSSISPELGAVNVAMTDITRQMIIDELNVGHIWRGGRLDEVAFLNRIYWLDQLPSCDHRYSDAD